MKLTTVWKVINEWDPMKKMDGVSIDHYKYEINRIASVHGSDVQSPEKLAKLIHDVFKSNYGSKQFKSSIDECLKIAKKLISDNDEEE